MCQAATAACHESLENTAVRSPINMALAAFGCLWIVDSARNIPMVFCNRGEPFVRQGKPHTTITPSAWQAPMVMTATSRQLLTHGTCYTAKIGGYKPSLDPIH
jgi:hypothetical protein